MLAEAERGRKKREGAQTNPIDIQSQARPTEKRFSILRPQKNYPSKATHPNRNASFES